MIVDGDKLIEGLRRLSESARLAAEQIKKMSAAAEMMCDIMACIAPLSPKLDERSSSLTLLTKLYGKISMGLAGWLLAIAAAADAELKELGYTKLPPDEDPKTQN